MTSQPTRYKGHWFKSKLEARWAVFFDVVGIKWKYEPRCFRLRSGLYYIPDFYLPDQNIWWEVKPDRPGELECQKAHDLCLLTKQCVFIEFRDFYNRRGIIDCRDVPELCRLPVDEMGLISDKILVDLLVDNNDDSAFCWRYSESRGPVFTDGYDWDCCYECGCIDMRIQGKCKNGCSFESDLHYLQNCEEYLETWKWWNLQRLLYILLNELNNEEYEGNQRMMYLVHRVVDNYFGGLQPGESCQDFIYSWVGAMEEGDFFEIPRPHENFVHIVKRLRDADEAAFCAFSGVGNNRNGNNGNGNNDLPLFR